jgi:hypothetical protein
MKLRKPSILVVNRVSSCLSFFLSASTAATYIFASPYCTTTIISLGPRALNAEFQHSYRDLIYKSNMVSVRLSVATKTRRGPETSEVLKNFEDLNRGVCLSVTTNSAGQDRAGAGARAGQGRGRAGQGRAAS